MDLDWVGLGYLARFQYLYGRRSKKALKVTTVEGEVESYKFEVESYK